MREIGTIKEPLMGYEQKVLVVPTGRLKVIDVQRRPSPFHVRRLGESMRKMGFVSPLVAVRKGEDLIVIDGQQRLLAAKELGIKELPCIVVPEKYAMNLMELNVEKQMPLREKAYVALNIYRTYLHDSPQMREDDPRILDSIEMPYYVTLGMGYEKNPKLFGSAYEAILKKLDGFFSSPLQDAAKERERRANLLVETEEIARRAVERVKEIGIAHPFVHREVVDFCNPIKGKREVGESFEGVFEKLKEGLRELIERPEMIRPLETDYPAPTAREG